jgi:hypothetical protein
MLATDDDTALLKLLPDHPCSTLADSCSSDRCRRDARAARPHQSRLQGFRHNRQTSARRQTPSGLD